MSTNETYENKLYRLVDEVLEMVRSMSVDFQIPYETQCWRDYEGDESTVRLLVDKALNEKQDSFVRQALDKVIPKDEPPEVRFQINLWVKKSLRKKAYRRNSYVQLKAKTYAELRRERAEASEAASRRLRRDFAKANPRAEKPNDMTPYLPGFG